MRTNPVRTKGLAPVRLITFGTTTSEMEPVFIAGADLQKRFYGAAETQFLFAADVPRAQRDQIISEFLSEMRQTIQAIGSRAPRGAAAAAWGR